MKIYPPGRFRAILTATMRIAIIQFPEAHFERETHLAVKRAGMEPITYQWNEPKEKLANFSGYVVVGRFPSLALDPFIGALKQQSEQGKPIIGICQGAHILVEAGLVPGLDKHKVGMALVGQTCSEHGTPATIKLTDHYQANAFTSYLKSTDRIETPVAHRDARFVLPPALQLEMKEHGLQLFNYVDNQQLAAVSNKSGNVMAMLPHIECSEQGDVIFQSMREYITKGVTDRVTPLRYHPRPQDIAPYVLPPFTQELISDVMVTDHHVQSIEKTLNQIGIPVRLRRQIHWEVECDSLATFDAVKKSGVLYNQPSGVDSNKPKQTKLNQMSYLVRAHADTMGQQKLQMLKNHFAIQGVRGIRHGIIWHLTAENNLVEYAKQVMDSHILFNPYAYDCYSYTLSDRI